MDFAFKTLPWVHSANIYEVNTRQYTKEGTFNAFVKELPRLKDMGVQILWFMPIHPIGEIKRLGSLGSYYSIKNYKATNPEFGTIEDFKNLVNAAHQSGFKVILDWVTNHTAWDNVWAKDHPEYYVHDSAGNFVSPYDWKDVIQINHKNLGEQDAMIDAMKFWVTECNIDGFRCDLAHLTPLNFWRKARIELDRIKPLFWLAESEEINYHEVFDTSFTWEFLHKMEAFWRKKTDIMGLDSVLQKYNTKFPPNAIRLYFTSNHDENSHSGSEYERMGDAAKLFAVFCATWNGIPLIYSGQELPVKKRIKFFDKDPIEWTGKNELYNFYKTLLNLHSTHPALRAGDANVITYRLKTSDDKRIFSFLRKNENKEVLVILNLSEEPHLHFNIDDTRLTGKFKNIFSGAENDFTTEKNFEIQAWDYLVFEK
ncbi:MAG: alpha-amylase family glycosyl hydrolase [Bacteroidota bacterium]|nr:alpha-amylase family glycosyl hydrolase [Bacteroidota bacterium]